MFKHFGFKRFESIQWSVSNSINVYATHFKVKIPNLISVYIRYGEIFSILSRIVNILTTDFCKNLRFLSNNILVDLPVFFQFVFEHLGKSCLREIHKLRVLSSFEVRRVHVIPVLTVVCDTKHFMLKQCMFLIEFW